MRVCQYFFIFCRIYLLLASEKLRNLWFKVVFAKKAHIFKPFSAKTRFIQSFLKFHIQRVQVEISLTNGSGRQHIRYCCDEYAEKNELKPWQKKWCIPKAEARRIAVRLEILRASAGSCFLAEYGGNRDRYSVKAMSGSTDNVLWGDETAGCSLAVSEEFFFSYSCLAVLRCWCKM